jgi:hypothetical protein
MAIGRFLLPAENLRGTKPGPERSAPMHHFHSGDSARSVFDLMRKQTSPAEAKLIKPWVPLPSPRGRR